MMIFYLSQLVPNPRSSKARRDLGNAYELHRTLARGAATGEQRILWRVEQGKLPHLLIQTLSEPDWSYLTEEVPPGYLREPPKVKPVELSLEHGQLLRFRLRANPTVKRTVDDKKKRLALYSEEEQLDWLFRKAEAAGFKPLDVSISNSELLEFKREKARVTINAVTFDGHMAVIEPDSVKMAVQGGIGSAKGFGMGLLSLGPLR